MIKTTNKNIYNAFELLKKLSEKSLPVKTSYAIAKLYQEVLKEYKVIDAERVKLGVKYGEYSDERKLYLIKPENETVFQGEYKILMSETVELNAKRIPLDVDMNLSAQEIIALEDFIEVNADDQ